MTVNRQNAILSKDCIIHIIIDDSFLEETAAFFIKGI